MSALRTWWLGLSQRERLLLAVMAVLAVMVGGWLLVLRPLAAARDASAARHAEAVVAAAKVKALATAIERAPRAVRQRDGLPLTDLVAMRAEAAGITLAGRQTTGADSVSISIAAIRPTMLAGWLAELERRDGLVVERVRVARNEDATVSAEAGLFGSR